MQLTLDETQATLLREVLESRLGELRMEIAGTDNPAFRRNLRAREETLRAIFDALGPQ